MDNSSKPRHVFQWHITHVCNLRCRHCYQQDYTHSMPREQLYQILDKYTAFTEQNGFLGQINLTGGEPLLHPEFFPLAREIKHRGFRLGILTNGTCIDRETARRLKALHPVFVQISLDGPRREHDRIRGKGAFLQALRGIRLLKAAGVRVLVSFTAQKHNLTGFRKLARICSLLGVDKLWWDRVVTDNPRDQAELALTTEEFQQFLGLARKLEAAYLRPDGTGMISNQRALQFIGCESPQCSYICSAGRQLFAVLADGTLMPCRRLPIVLGNILERDFQSLLDSEGPIRSLRQQSHPADCANCGKLRQCMGGARCIAFGQTGSAERKDPNCFLKAGLPTAASEIMAFPQ